MQEDQEYWEKVAESIDKPTAKQELKRLDLSYPSGIPPNKKFERLAKNSDTMPMPQLARQYKELHPRKVILIRVRRPRLTSLFAYLACTSHHQRNVPLSIAFQKTLGHVSRWQAA